MPKLTKQYIRNLIREALTDTPSIQKAVSNNSAETGQDNSVDKNSYAYHAKILADLPPEATQADVDSYISRLQDMKTDSRVIDALKNNFKR